MKYNLDLDGTDLSSVCVQCPSCNSADAWDSSDAVRAVSLCKARYHASTAGVALPPELDDYCNTWVSTGFFLQGNEQYVRSYTLAGAHCLIGAGYEEYSLGSYLRFHYSPQRYSDYIGMAVNQFDSLSTPTRFGTSSDPNYCAGIYFPAFVAVSFGSGIGRDTAFTRPALDMLALTAAASSATNIDVAWTDVMASSFRVQRSTNGTTWTDRGTTTGRSFTDTADPGSAYLYRVQALDGAQNVIGTSNSDLVTTFVISPVVGGNNVQAADFNARITAINKVREMAGLTSIAPVGQGQTIAAGHVQSMRAALEEVRVQFGLAPVSYRQLPVVAAASVIHTWEMNEIGEGLR